MNNLIIVSVLTLIMVLLVMYVFFSTKACGLKNINYIGRIFMFGGYILYFITVLYSLIKSIYYGHITINKLTIIILVISILLSFIGIIINKIKKNNIKG